ncbi:MAG: efflux RND transporter periplasmic adaptor subunit [Syntrophomonadaceae bacterium]|jgi:HlyD family secretion protein
MKNKKAWIVGGLVLTGIVLAAALTTSSRAQVEVVNAIKGTFILSVEETGYVQSADDYFVQATQAARVQELLVDAGDKVKVGDTLLRLSSPELETETASISAQLAQAEAELKAAKLGAKSLNFELELAENDLTRKKTLLESGALPLVEYEQSELKVEILKKDLSQQEAVLNGLNRQVSSLKQMLGSVEGKLSELQVISPAAGTVLDLPVKSGQVVAPGTVLAQVGTDDIEVKTELLSDEIRQVKIGQSTSITAPVLGDEVLIGKVCKIYPQAFAKTSALGIIQRRVPVIISMVEKGNLKPGYEVRVAIETLRKEEVILLPRESVRLTNDGKYRVMLVNEGRIEERVIEVGEKNQQWVEVVSGIKPGATVVRDGSLELKPGSRVKAVVDSRK